jgi:hypothetical protein
MKVDDKNPGDRWDKIIPGDERSTIYAVPCDIGNSMMYVCLKEIAFISWEG